MKKFQNFKGIVVPLDRSNVDTDAIIPKQFLKSVKRTGFGPNLFDEWRYLDKGEPGVSIKERPLNNNFVLNQERYQGASILLTKKNFGCGSSREHAPWAILGYGIKSIIASSFADIFYNNCIKNGILPIVLEQREIENLFEKVKKNDGFNIHIDLVRQSIKLSSGDLISFEIDKYKKSCLINGLDEISQTLEKKDKIFSFEKKYKNVNPWLFEEIQI
jgi:3-isopropylmalate/(R)-2-methylmalate dehydratase small subunit